MAKLIKVSKDLEVKKADVIVKARYRLNPLSIKFITTLIAGLKRSDDINEVYRFRVKEFQELSNLKRKDLYKAIKNALEELLEKPLYVPTKNGFFMCNWISGGEYIENKGEITFSIYPKLRPYLLEAKEKFLKYRLENILSLRSGYSIRLYEILKDWFELYNRYKAKAEKIISVKELREMLEIPDSYQYSSHIKKIILEKAKVELADKTDIKFDYEEIKTGRKVTHIKFIIKQNNKENKEKELIEEKNYNLKTFMHFVKFLREKYKGTNKAFMIKIIEERKERYYLKINEDGLIYGVDENGEIRSFNSMESEKIYYNTWQLAIHCDTYYDFLNKKEDLLEKIYDVEFVEKVKSKITELKEKSLLK